MGSQDNSVVCEPQTGVVVSDCGFRNALILRALVLAASGKAVPWGSLTDGYGNC
jgi:hypothetical protein